jgi:hypothetical protein
MTLGALVLEWVQPNSVASATPSIGLMAPLNGSAPWRSIHVVPHRTAGSHQTRSTHWIVDRDGRASQTDHWKASRRLAPGGEIRISLVAPAQSNEITPRQWSAAQELLSRLRSEYNIPQNLVVIDDTLDLPTVARPAHPRPQS